MIGTLEGVNALVPSVGVFSSTSTPSDAQISVWLDEATVLVHGALAAAGYSTTIATSAAVMPALEAMTQLYAAATVLSARGLDTLSGMDETRSEQMYDRFYEMLAMLVAGKLSALGVAVIVTAGHRRMRTRQTRRIDGYSATYEGSASAYAYPSE